MAALSLASLSALAPAHAGSYIGPVYAGGTAHQAAYTGHPVVPYALGSSTFQGGSYGGYGGDAGGTVSASCTGTITTTFTWQPNPGQTLTSDPPPLNVILQETCMAAASGTSIPAATVGGSCDNGLGVSQGALTQIPSTYGYPPTVYGMFGIGLVNSTRYQIITGTPTITLTRTPSASVSCLQGVNASVRYTATISPVILTLTGTTKDSSNQANILIGQGCSGSLSAGPTTLSNFQWNPGGDTFDKFLVAPDLSSGHVVLLFGDTWAKPSPLWHYSKDSNGSTTTIKCSATASINGTAIGTVQAQQTIQVWAPYYMFKNMAGPVTVANLGAMALYAGGPPTILPSGNVTWSPPGMKNGGRVGTPALFIASLTNSGTGRWQFVQLAAPGRWEYQTTFGNTAVYPNKYDGMYGLDNLYPYPSDAGTYAPPFPADSDEASGPTASPTYWMDDSPLQQLADRYSRVRVDESFDDYMMYVPPDDGLGSEWVPLHLFKWKWQADISQIGAGWAAGWTPTPPGYVSNLSSARCTTHPLWQMLLLNDN